MGMSSALISRTINIELQQGTFESHEITGDRNNLLTGVSRWGPVAHEGKRVGVSSKRGWFAVYFPFFFFSSMRVLLLGRHATLWRTLRDDPNNRSEGESSFRCVINI